MSLSTFELLQKICLMIHICVIKIRRSQCTNINCFLHLVSPWLPIFTVITRVVIEREKKSLNSLENEKKMRHTSLDLESPRQRVSCECGYWNAHRTLFTQSMNEWMFAVNLWQTRFTLYIFTKQCSSVKKKR